MPLYFSGVLLICTIATKEPIYWERDAVIRRMSWEYRVIRSDGVDIEDLRK